MATLPGAAAVRGPEVCYVLRRAGDSTADETEVSVLEEGRPAQPLPLRLDLCNHSPTGFSWGYAGSGPAQLALAMCAHAFGDEVALLIYQQVKRVLLAGEERAAFALLQDDLARAAGEALACAREAVAQANAFGRD